MEHRKLQPKKIWVPELKQHPLVIVQSEAVQGQQQQNSGPLVSTKPTSTLAMLL